jgi:hypothetical protein
LKLDSELSPDSEGAKRILTRAVQWDPGAASVDGSGGRTYRLGEIYRVIIGTSSPAGFVTSPRNPRQDLVLSESLVTHVQGQRIHVRHGVAIPIPVPFSFPPRRVFSDCKPQGVKHLRGRVSLQDIRLHAFLAAPDEISPMQLATP